MNQQQTGQDVEADMKRRIHRVGTGASNAPGHLDTDAGPSTADAEKDIEGRIRRRGTGASDHPGKDD
ncbi:hypothetical protein [Actinomadura monticuli]|uniref:Phosphatidylethanolamine-binding protein n=1 Tax=Actinomadura monticuli TaxID=3097367 RepID=A0ABV4QH08_9ACTN